MCKSPIATHLFQTCDAMSSLYEHLEENSLRLLTISEHNGTTAILKIQTYPRISAPRYEAVSYTWGDDPSTATVMCNGMPLEIQTNLFRALPFFILRAFPSVFESRPTSNPRTRPLWIDAICLNQNDREEKAVHVPHMSDIYKNASRTLVWLGEAAQNSDLAMDNIQQLTHKLSMVKNPSSLSVVQKLANYNMPPHSDPVWEAIRQLQLRPWFYRLWTLQEIVLSKKAVLWCGRKVISWDALFALHEAASQAELIGMVHARRELEPPFRHSFNMIGHVDILRKLEKIGSSLDLSKVLTLSGNRSYSVPVDRVWALLGLLDERYQQNIRDAGLIDYSEAAMSNYHETFLNLARFQIKHDTCVAMRIIEDNSRTVRNPMLPSWCPDWHADKGEPSLALFVGAFAGTPGGQSRRIDPFMYVNDDASLELCGLIADVIDCVTKSVGDVVLSIKSYPWLIECLDIIKSTSFGPFDVDPTQAAIPAIPTAWSTSVSIPEQQQEYMRAKEVLMEVLYPPSTPLKEFSRNLGRCDGRRFFRTKAGRFGIGPADLAENDFLCSMYGARALWGLRPLDAEKQEFEFLGCAYTPSLLKGEAWAGTSCEEMRRFKLR